MTPYNTSLNALEKRKPQLDKLLKGEIVTFQSISGSPHMLAYYLREAIQAARYHKVEPYASIKYIFRAESGNSVRAIPRQDHLTEMAVHEGIRSEMTIDEPVNEFSVITHATRRTEDQIVFSNFDGRVKPVKSWADKHGFTVETEPLTLTRKQES